MDIEILEFIPDRKGIKVGFVDFKVTYSPEKYELFRNVGYFEKDNKEWLNIGNVQRNEKWVPRYERAPSFKNMLSEALKALKAYLKENTTNQQSSSDLYW